jgi:hypothetical protein
MLQTSSMASQPSNSSSIQPKSLPKKFILLKTSTGNQHNQNLLEKRAVLSNLKNISSLTQLSLKNPLSSIRDAIDQVKSSKS